MTKWLDKENEVRCGMREEKQRGEGTEDMTKGGEVKGRVGVKARRESKEITLKGVKGDKIGREGRK